MKNLGVGAVILLLFLQSCTFQTYQNASPTFREAFFADEEAIANFLTKGMPQPSRSLNEGELNGIGLNMHQIYPKKVH
jgi:hypothetical protein